MAALSATRKRSISEVDDDDHSPLTSAKILKLDLPQQAPSAQPSLQSRILPFRASPTSKHTLSFAQCSRSRPATLISASGALTPESSEDEDKPRSFFLPAPAELNLRTPPRTKSSTNSNFDAFSTIRDATDIDTDMADSPAPSLAWTSPASSPPSPLPKSRYAPAATPPSPSSSRMTLATPPPPKPSRFKLQPPPRPDQIIGGRVPTPTYGHFRLDSEDEISPRTRQKGSFLRRGPCPPSPISEDEFESPSAIAGGMLGKLNISSPSMSRNRYAESPVKSKLGRIAEGEAELKKGGTMGYRADGQMDRIGGMEKH